MREQTSKIHTGRWKRRLAVPAVIIVIFAICALIWRVVVFEEVYIPPEFDTTAQEGTPKPEESLGYSDISVEHGFTFAIVGTLYQQEDETVLVYFTNPADSGCNMQCEITDEAGEVLYKSGVVRPGEYVERLTPVKELTNETREVNMNVYAFELNTWYSKGTISLANTLQAW